ncbi:MAG: hypothetical protein FWD97_08320 [Defluviitaleaceae bacterium]|nr:hypothetical protein [Defluviitaleaceae bacterium]
MNKQNERETKKWDFEDYAFTIATVLFSAFMIVGIVLVNSSETIGEDIQLAFDGDAIGLTNIHRWWPFSWMLFMFAWSVCTIKDVLDIKRGAKGAGNDLEGAVEYALYVGITTIMLLIGIMQGQMHSSWLAGPIVFVVFTIIWPVLRNRKDKEQVRFSVISVSILLAGIVVEILVGGWIAFPVSWILISAIKVYKTIRKYKFAEDAIVDIIYHSLSVILISASLIWGSWIISWLAYPVAVITSKVMGKMKRKTA